MSFARIELIPTLYTAMAKEKEENERKEKERNERKLKFPDPSPKRPKLQRTQAMKDVEEADEATKPTEALGAFEENAATDTQELWGEGCTCMAAQDPTCPLCGGW